MNQVIPAKSKLILLFSVFVLVALGSMLFIILHHEDGDYRVTFTLQDTKGNSVTEESLKGQWSILVFGFTHCPDVCPSQVFTIAESLKAFDEKAVDSVAEKNIVVKKVQAVFISVDYQRDNTESLEQYLGYFDPRFIGFLGTKLQLDLVTDSFDASYSVSKWASSSTDIEVTHSSSIYLIDPTGRIAKQLPFETNSKTLVNTLSTLM